jgi:hypothetical protein
LRKNLTLLAALAALVGAGGAVAWWMRPEPPRAALPAKPPDDDIAMVASLLDGSEPREAAHDRLAAYAGSLYLARASDRAILATPADGGAARVVAHLDGPAWGMAVAAGGVWLSTARADDAGPAPPERGRTGDGTSPAPPERGRTGKVVRVPLEGGAPRVVADGLHRPRALASDGRWVFVVDSEAGDGGLLRASTIVRVPAEGGAPVVVARCEGDVTGIALDDANAYWADEFDGTIVAVPKAGGEPRSLATGRGLPEQVVAYGDALYWVERRSETVVAMPRAGGPPRHVVQDFAGFSHLVVDERGVWWATEAPEAGRFRVLRAPPSGGEPSPASEAVDGIDALASDGAHLYWARNGEVSRVDGSAGEGRQQHARKNE